MDRSKEVQDVLAEKATSYLEYYASGGFAVRNGATVADKKLFPFRLLIVLKTAERRNNTAARLVQNESPVLTLTWLTTLEEITRDPLGAIWIQPRAYRDVTAGTGTGSITIKKRDSHRILRGICGPLDKVAPSFEFTGVRWTRMKRSNSRFMVTKIFARSGLVDSWILLANVEILGD